MNIVSKWTGNGFGYHPKFFNSKLLSVKFIALIIRMVFIFYFKVLIASLITLLSASMPLSLSQHSFFGGDLSVKKKWFLFFSQF